MTYALIDNSTLTAVQRIVGNIATKSRDSVDVDIIAFENYIQAILFYDRLIAIDDYIPAHVEGRKKYFSQINFINKNEFNLNDIENIATEKASQLRPKIKGGDFVNDDFKGLIELLQTHIVCTWDISSSVYHLTLKSLSNDNEDFMKYGNIAAAIFSELGDVAGTGQKINGNVELVDQYGSPIRQGYKIPGAKWGDGKSTGEASPAIKAFVASLIWLANRSIFYSLTAKYLQADTFLYPIRQAYQQYYISQACNYGFDYAKNIVQHFSTSVSKDLVDIPQGGIVAATSISLPLFSGWLAKQTGDSAKIIEAAYNIRNNTEFVEAREKLREVRRLLDESDISSTNKAIRSIVKDIEKASGNIRVKYGLQTRQGTPVTNLVHVYNTCAALQGFPKLPNYNFKIKLPEFFYDLKRPRGFASIYRNITKDLSAVWSMGEARDILGGNVVTDEDARVYSPKQEQPQYRNAHSRFKSPM